jgi:hypothetical protein
MHELFGGVAEICLEAISELFGLAFTEEIQNWRAKRKHPHLLSLFSEAEKQGCGKTR